ncbi:MAG: TldD/PmbA family protein [Bacillota bacterium]
MLDKLKQALSCASGYADLRYEITTLKSFSFTGKELSDVSFARREGGFCRCLAGSGWGQCSFAGQDDMASAVRRAKSLSRITSRYTSEPVRLAWVPPAQEIVRVNPSQHPDDVDDSDKIELLRKYNEICLAVPRVATTNAYYTEYVTTKYFCSTEGAAICQEQVLTGIRLIVTAREGALSQSVRMAFGGTPDCVFLLGHEARVEEKAKLASDLLDAEPVEAGNYPVVLDPECAGVFVHEAFGHLSEADNLIGNESLERTMELGRRFGGKWLNIVDDASWPENPGSYRYDDEGVIGSRTYLLKHGLLAGRLHSRQTAGRLGEAPTGHARAKDFTFQPIVRMSNIFIEPGEHSLKDLLEAAEGGLYLVGAAGGQTSGDMFTFAAQCGYKIRDGQLGVLVRDAVLSGNLFVTLNAISLVGNDINMSRAGGCGKDGQILAASGTGSPHIKIDSLTIGGR